MPKSWQSTRSGARDLNRHIRKGTTVYTVSEQVTRMAPWEDQRMWTAHTFDWRSPITGHWMTGHMSAEGLLSTYGTVYEQPPRNMRELGSPSPEVGGPVPAGYRAHLDEAEIRGLGKRVRDSSDPHLRSF
jgi:hypothetical protein